MKTRIEDLESDEREMVESKARKENEIKILEGDINLIREMIKMMKAARPQVDMQIGKIVIETKPTSLRVALRNELEKPNAGWMSAGVLSKIIWGNGLAGDREWTSYRASISSTLRKMSESGEIKQRNRGTKEGPIFEYGNNRLGEYQKN
jgi:hypothetical protein